MEPSSDSNRWPIFEWLDWASFFGITAGLFAYVIPFWPEGRLRVAFWLMLVSTLLHVCTAHLRRPVERGGPES